jgi:heterotetrameric sarcosine oxidase delta subunit
MSLTLTCPHCGIRSIEEFVYGEIPVVPDAITDPDARDVDRAFMRGNVQGVQSERWFHLYGCRRWMTVRRDTRTNATYAATASTTVPQ